MKLTELLTVEAAFQIARLGLVLLPDFPIKDDWEDRTEAVTVIKPDGEECDATAKFSLIHFNISDSKVSIDKRWRIVVSLLNLHKEDVPIGSKLLISKEAAQALLSHHIE